MMQRYSTIKLVPGAGLSLPVVAGEAVKALHFIYAQKKIPFALAFPSYAVESGSDRKTLGDQVQVFTADESGLNVILDSLEVDDLLRSFVHPGRIRKVPENWSGRWAAYVRFRIPNNNVREILPEYCKKGHAKVREFRTKKAEVLPFLHYRSTSTGQKFAIHVEKKVYDEPLQAAGKPDSFGLSRTMSICALPLLESA